MPTFVELRPGELAPWFRQPTISQQVYNIDTVGGRYVVLCFFGSASTENSSAAIAAMKAMPEFFDDVQGAFFGVTADPTDLAQGRIAESFPGYRFILDYDGAAARLYGAAARDADEKGAVPMRGLWVVLNPTLRIIKTFSFRPDKADIAAVTAYLKSLPPAATFAGFELQAPILYLPDVFEPALCEKLIGLYDSHGGIESGFMREVDGRTVKVEDHSHKRRKDYTIDDKELIGQLQSRFMRRVVPEIKKAHQYEVTRMERYIVACYAAEDQAHFGAHRDNTTKGTAHRRFAVSVNLNDDFDGGQVSFPEYGPRSYKAPAGGAVVFSCSLLHKVSQVTRGRRFAFLPFLYDDAAAKIREQNNPFLGEGVGQYREGGKAETSVPTA